MSDSKLKRAQNFYAKVSLIFNFKKKFFIIFNMESLNKIIFILIFMNKRNLAAQFEIANNFFRCQKKN